jgi:hypothetical protein
MIYTKYKLDDLLKELGKIKIYIDIETGYNIKTDELVYAIDLLSKFIKNLEQSKEYQNEYKDSYL